MSGPTDIIREFNMINLIKFTLVRSNSQPNNLITVNLDYLECNRLIVHSQHGFHKGRSLVLLRYVKYCFRSINDTINQKYRDNDTIIHISRFPAAIITSPKDTRVCCIGLLSAAHPGSVAPSKYLPSSQRLPVMCESRNSECAFRSCLLFCIRDHARVCNYMLHCHVVCSM